MTSHRRCVLHYAFLLHTIHPWFLRRFHWDSTIMFSLSLPLMPCYLSFNFRISWINTNDKWLKFCWTGAKPHKYHKTQSFKLFAMLKSLLNIYLCFVFFSICFKSKTNESDTIAEKCMLSEPLPQQTREIYQPKPRMHVQLLYLLSKANRQIASFLPFSVCPLKVTQPFSFPLF